MVYTAQATDFAEGEIIVVQVDIAVFRIGFQTA